MKQAGLQPFDIRLDAIPVGIGDFHGCVTVYKSEGETTRTSFDIFDFQHALDLSRAVFRRVEALVRKTEFRREALSDPNLLDALAALNSALYAIRVGDGGDRLRDIILSVLAGSATPTLIVHGAMRLIPWELTTPEGDPTSSPLLGARAHIVGSTDSEISVDVFGGRAAYRPKPRTNVVGISDPIRLRAIGNTALEGAPDEADLVVAPNVMTTGTVAPRLLKGDSKKAFFDHFGGTDYDLVHVFAHCRYTGREFKLKVSDDVDLSRADFFSHEVEFPHNAFHFLNVCNGAPAPDNHSFSFVEYLAKQQAAGGMLASLTSVRSTSAVAMATAFYKEFLPSSAGLTGSSAAEALMRARESLWNQDFAAGYLYRTYGRQDYVLQSLTKMLEAANA